MVITPIHSEPITTQDSNIQTILDRFVTHISERSVLAITSKVISLSEGNVIPIDGISKNEIAMKEAELFLPPEENQYHKVVSIKNHTLIISAGVDSRNTNGFYVLHPRDPFTTAANIWMYLKNRFGLRQCGVIITDSHTTPLRRGVTGISIGYCGFSGVYAPNNQHDIFGQKLSGPINTADALSASAVFVMGETDEQTPFSLLSDIPSIQWQDHPPTKEERSHNFFSIENDIYGPLLEAVPWKKGLH